MKSILNYINENRVKDIYGNDLTDFFKKKYGSNSKEVQKIAQLLSDYFYGSKKQYHRSDTSYLEVEKTFNRGMGRGLMLVVKPQDKEVWVNTSMATARDIELVNSMLNDNDINYSVVKKSYDLWGRKWE